MTAIPSRVTVMGLGGFGGGEGAARFFAERGARVTVTDLRSAEALAQPMARLAGLAVTYHLGEHPESDFTDTDCVVVNPAVKPNAPFLALARRHGVRLDTAINVFLRESRAPVVAVTGSNGKSTTTQMIHEMMLASGRRSWLGGNIGGSLLGKLGEIEPDDVIVLELSSFQLDRLPWGARAPEVGVAINVTPNHLDWHGTFDAYAAAKRNLVTLQRPGDTAVLNVDDPVVAEWREVCGGGVFAVSREGPDAAWREDSVTLRRGDEQVEVSFAALQLSGPHNRQNAALGASAAWLLGAAPDAIEDALRRLAPLPHRLETVAERDGVRYVEDSVATTPESTIAALRSFEGRVHLIAGGSSKGTPFDELGRVIAERATTVVLIGRTAPEIEAAIPPGAPVEVVRADTLDEAVAAARRRARAGDTVLLSPACASFDMFTNYVDRAEQFRALVGTT